MPIAPQPEPKKIVYFFGAGATHAELANLDGALVEKGQGLLIRHVSARVIEKARRDARYRKDVELVSGTSGSLNIELLISLIENSKIHGWEYKTRRLKNLVKEDIENILIEGRTRRFYLHRGLLEFHQHPITSGKEKLIGLISLNYDNILDRAYKESFGDPNYCFSLEREAQSLRPIPLLKLHGSFDWRSQRIRGRMRNIEIIPLGSNKTYLHAPYIFIWNRALEILIECNTLRVIGCSLSQDDVHLIDLLFKAHLERDEAFDIEIINSDRGGDEIKRNYGFLSGIRTLTKIEGNLIPEADPPNAFKTWLKYKSIAMLGPDIEGGWRILHSRQNPGAASFALGSQRVRFLTSLFRATTPSHQFRV